VLVITASDLRSLVSMRDAITAVHQAFVALSFGRAAVPVRTVVPVAGRDAVLLAMPGVLVPPETAHIRDAAEAPSGLGAKLVSVFPGNAAAGLPVVQAVVVLFDQEAGRPLALLEGTSLTALRTGAASGMATELLALPEAGIVALFGAGAQARTQLEAVCAVRPVTQVRVVDRRLERAEAFAAWARGQTWIGGATVLAVSDPEIAVRGAEIIVTATTSPTPVFPGRAVGPGAHVNAIGAFQPETREVDSELVARAAIFVDNRAAALAEAGDLLIPIREGVLAAEAIRGEIGEVAAGRTGRRGAQEITLFKSVGSAVQDLAVAGLAVARATASGRGIRVRLDR
jgi:ornithine cyclodeaminase